jgi:hypothetical protein
MPACELDDLRVHYLSDTQQRQGITADMLNKESTTRRGSTNQDQLGKDYRTITGG